MAHPDQKLSEEDRREQARIVVVNALVDLLVHDAGVLTTEESRSILAEAYEAATDEATREAFERALGELSELDRAETAERSPIVDETVDGVIDVLAERAVVVEVTHQSETEFLPRRAAVYSFLRTRALPPASAFAFSGAIRDEVDRGVECASEGAFEDAAAAFETALDGLDVEAGGADPGEGDEPEAPDDETVALQLLAGWSYFWAGETRKATYYADRALTDDWNTWEAKLLWIAATHYRADEIREGTLATVALVKWLTDVPTGGELSLEVGFDDGDGVTWESVSTDRTFAILDRVGRRTLLRFHLTGSVDAFPFLYGYYVGVGTVSVEWDEIKQIERVLHSGPVSADPVEGIELRRP